MWCSKPLLQFVDNTLLRCPTIQYCTVILALSLSINRLMTHHIMSQVIIQACTGVTICALMNLICHYYARFIFPIQTIPITFVLGHIPILIYPNFLVSIMQQLQYCLAHNAAARTLLPRLLCIPYLHQTLNHNKSQCIFLRILYILYSRVNRYVWHL